MRFRDGPLSVQNVTGSNNLHTSFTYLKVGFSQMYMKWRPVKFVIFKKHLALNLNSYGHS